MTQAEEEIIANLRDAGCDKETIGAFLCDLKEENLRRGMLRLEVHRKKLLDTIHKYQRCIDCLDYLEHEIKKSAKRG